MGGGGRPGLPLAVPSARHCALCRGPVQEARGRGCDVQRPVSLAPPHDRWAGHSPSGGHAVRPRGCHPDPRCSRGRPVAPGAPPLVLLPPPVPRSFSLRNLRGRCCRFNQSGKAYSGSRKRPKTKHAHEIPRSLSPASSVTRCCGGRCPSVGSGTLCCGDAPPPLLGGEKGALVLLAGSSHSPRLLPPQASRRARPPTRASWR